MRVVAAALRCGGEESGDCWGIAGGGELLWDAGGCGGGGWGGGDGGGDCRENGGGCGCVCVRKVEF